MERNSLLHLLLLCTANHEVSLTLLRIFCSGQFVHAHIPIIIIAQIRISEVQIERNGWTICTGHVRVDSRQKKNATPGLVVIICSRQIRKMVKLNYARMAVMWSESFIILFRTKFSPLLFLLYVEMCGVNDGAE